jgi:hypothetical protein
VDPPDPEALTIRAPISVSAATLALNTVVVAPMVLIGNVKDPITAGDPLGSLIISMVKDLDASMTSTFTVIVVKIEATGILSPQEEDRTFGPKKR